MTFVSILSLGMGGQGMTSLKVSSEPVRRDANHFVYGALFGKQVRGSGNHMQQVFSRESGRRRPIPPQNVFVFFAHDQESGRDHVRQVFRHEIRSSPA